MNQLSNIVIDFARFSRATSMKRGMIALDQPHRRRQAGASYEPMAARQRDRPIDLRLGDDARRARCGASLATLTCSLKDPNHERWPEKARRTRIQRFDGRPQQNSILNLKTLRRNVGNTAANSACLLRRFSKEAHHDHSR